MAGIACGNLYRFPDCSVYLLLLVVLLLMAFLRPPKRHTMSPILLSLSIFLLGVLEINLYLHPTVKKDHVLNFIGNEKIFIEGMVCENPQVSPDKTDLVVSVARLFHKGQYRSVHGCVLLTVREYYPFHYGDVIRFHARLNQPRNFGNPGGFDYKTYLRLRGILVRGSVNDKAGFIVLRSSRGNPFKTNLERFRDLVRNVILDRSPGTEGRIIQAMILGDQKGIPKEIMERFNRTGTTHIIAISGFNIGIVAIFALFMARFCLRADDLLLRWNAKYISTFFAMIVVILYTLIAGAGISVVRASIMALVFLFSILMNRERDLWNSLALAAFMILTLAPYSLFDISFQLSFTAVASLIYFMPKWIALLPVMPIRTEEHQSGQMNLLFRKSVRGIAIFFLASLSATLSTLPLILLYFNRLSLITLAANLVCVPILGILAIPVSLLIILAVPLSSTLAGWVIQVSELLVRISLIFIDKLASLRWASLYVSTPNLVEIVVFYLLLIWSGLLLDWFATRRTAKRVTKMTFPLKAIPIILMFVFCVDSLYLYLNHAQQGRLSLTAVDVGQGNSLLVRFPGGGKMLVDGGGYFDDSFDMGKFVLAPYLWHERITRIDTVVLTHPHPDHLNGLLFILENFDVREVWINGETSPMENYLAFRRIILEKGIMLKTLSDKTPMSQISGVKIEVLNPAECGSNPKAMDSPSLLSDADDRSSADGADRRISFTKSAKLLHDATNDRSLVLKLTFGEKSFLLSADISATVEKRLLRSNVDLQSDVIFMPHHGSYHSSGISFIKRVNPKIAVVSCGAGNTFGFPSQDVLRRYESIQAEIFRTDLNGAVTITTDGQKMTVAVYHSGHRGSQKNPIFFDDGKKEKGPRQKNPGPPSVDFDRNGDYYLSRARKTPAASAVPITPATLGPIAAISGFTLPPVCSETNFWTTRADMGTAETPAAPMQGLILFPSGRNRLRSFAKSTPPAVLKMKAMQPRTRMKMVWGLMKLVPSIVEPTASARKIVTALIRWVPAVLLRRSVTPDSRIRFPNMSIPINGATEGTTRAVINVETIGKTRTVIRDTGLACFIWIARSFFVVNSRMTGGWMTGTRDM